MKLIVQESERKENSQLMLIVGKRSRPPRDFSRKSLVDKAYLGKARESSSRKRTLGL